MMNVNPMGQGLTFQSFIEGSAINYYRLDHLRAEAEALPVWGEQADKSQTIEHCVGRQVEFIENISAHYACAMNRRTDSSVLLKNVNLKSLSG